MLHMHRHKSLLDAAFDQEAVDLARLSVEVEGTDRGE
jgi:hypothetical protein